MARRVLSEVKIPKGAARKLHKGLMRSLRVGINKDTGELDLSGYITRSLWGAGRGLGVVVVNLDDEHVDLESKPGDPHTIETLKALVRIDPNVGRFLIWSRGSSTHGDVNSLIRKFDKQTTEPDSKKIPTLYHGTSTAFLDKIERFGLRPRGDTGSFPTYGGQSKPSIPNRVYLGELHTAQDAARQAGSLHGGVPVVYKVVLKGTGGELEPDEDSDEETWWRSLRKIATVAYRGRIPASWLKPHMALPSKSGGWREGWRKWDGRQFPREQHWKSAAERHAEYEASRKAEREKEWRGTVNVSEALQRLHDLCESDRDLRDLGRQAARDYSRDVPRGLDRLLG